MVGSNNAAGYQLAAGEPVMAIGGFNGTDPAPTLDEFKRFVADRRIHYFIGGDVMGPGAHAASGSRAAEDIAEWVEGNYTSYTIDSVTVYDLTVAPRYS